MRQVREQGNARRLNAVADMPRQLRNVTSLKGEARTTGIEGGHLNGAG